MAWMLLLILFGRGDRDCIDTRAVDMIELSHIADSKGNIVFSQIILWKIDPVDGRYHNYGWRHAQPWMGAIERRGSRWCVIGKDDTERIKFIAPVFRESWSHIDPEQEDRRKYWRGESPNLFQKQTRPAVVMEVESE